MTGQGEKWRAMTRRLLDNKCPVCYTIKAYLDGEMVELA